VEGPGAQGLLAYDRIGGVRIGGATHPPLRVHCAGCGAENEVEVETGMALPKKATIEFEE